MILITGAFGQDGKILQEKLSKDNKLILVSRKSINDKIAGNCILENGDLQDIAFVKYLFKRYDIKIIFNLATNSFVERESDLMGNFNIRCNIFDNIIKTIIANNKIKETWIFHPLSSEVFGIPNEIPQGLSTHISPINSYGIQKSIELIKCRFLVSEGFNIFHPIIYNHESKFRQDKYFTKKTIKTLINISKNRTSKPLEFYNSCSSRDFGYAYDFVDAFIMAMELKITGDEVFGTGINTSILDFIRYTLHELKVVYEIIKDDSTGLIKIINNDKILAIEIGMSEKDQRRVFMFNGKFKNECFNDLNFIKGNNLIRKLIKEELKIN